MRITPTLRNRLRGRLRLAGLALAGLALALAAVGWPLRATEVWAHAAYVESSPGFAETLDDRPDEISLRFSQELFRRDGANTITLSRDAAGGAGWTEIAALSPPQITNADRKRMSVTVLVDLPPGRYRVSWTNLSAEDGDIDVGWFPFYIERGPTAAEQARDRAQAQALLITYADDAPSAVAGAVAGTADPALPVVAIVRADAAAAAGLSVSSIAWLCGGAASALALLAALGIHVRRTRVVG